MKRVLTCVCILILVTLLGSGCSGIISVPDGKLEVDRPEHSIIACGDNHTLLVRDNGTVWAWGQNTYGQLGNGNRHSELNYLIDTDITDKVISLASHHDYLIMLLSDGSVWTLGTNIHGRLGDGTTIDRRLPVNVKNLDNVKSIDCGAHHGIALTTDGTVWTWGRNEEGQLGHGTNVDAKIPQKVEGLSNITNIAAGNHFNIALDDRGKVWSWGDNTYGQLGNGTTNEDNVKEKYPALVKGLDNIVSIAAGYNHVIVVKDDGTVWTWGRNNRNQLGSIDKNISDNPVKMENLSDIVKVYAFKDISMTIDVEGKVWRWSSMADAIYTEKPRTVKGLENVVDILEHPVGYFHIIMSEGLAVKEDGTIVALHKKVEWQGPFDGHITVEFITYEIHTSDELMASSDRFVLYKDENDSVQLASRDYLPVNRSNIPVHIEKFSNIKAISRGETLIIKDDGSLWNLLLNDFYQIDQLNEIAIASSSRQHSLAVKDDGSLWAWGNNCSGQLGDGTTTDRENPQHIAVLDGIVDIVAGVKHSVALDEDGNVWVWGATYYEDKGSTHTNPVKIEELDDIVAIAAGDSFTLALKKDGTVWAWGNNEYGQLGNGTSSNHYYPEKIEKLTDIISIAVGRGSAFAVAKDGTVWAWGLNDTGQLGIGSDENMDEPVLIDGLENVSKIGAGQSHAIALIDNGNLMAWGLGRLMGTGAHGTYHKPVVLDTIEDVIDISAGDYRSIALKDDGTTWIWGSFIYNEIPIYENSPVQVKELSDIASVAGGKNFSLALNNQGTVNMWGISMFQHFESYGPLVGSVKADRLADRKMIETIPVVVNTLQRTVKVQGGNYHVVAVDEDGDVWAFGRNDYGQSGELDYAVDRFIVEKVNVRERIVSIACGAYHTIALDSYGNIVGWGKNAHGQLGDGTYANRRNPVQIDGIFDIVAIACGENHSVALDRTGQVYEWGSVKKGSRYTPMLVRGIDSAVAVVAGWNHTIALKEDGTVWAWGDNAYGQLGDGTYDERYNPVQVEELENIQAIAAGKYHSVAITVDGQIWAWGRNNYGQVGDGTFLNRILPVQIRNGQ